MQALDKIKRMIGLNQAVFHSTEELKLRYTNDESRFINIDGMNIHYRDEGKGPTLLVLHGIFSSLHTWDGWTQALSKYYRIIRLDLPSFGLSDAMKGEKVNKDSYPDFLNGFCQALGLKQVFLAGNSLGGYFSYQFAAKYPDRVKKLILLDSAGFHFVPPVVLMAWGAPFSGTVVNNIRIPRRAVAWTVRQVFAKADRADDAMIDRYLALLNRQSNRLAGTKLLHFVRNNLGFDTKALKQLNIPVLIMWGQKDRWMPKRHVKSFCANISDSRSIIYPDCGHMPMDEQPEITAKDAHQFLTVA